MKLTKRLAKAEEIVGIDVPDYIIIGGKNTQAEKGKGKKK